MKLSYDWLQDYIDLSDTSVNEVADKLTMGAFEVEGIETVGDKLEGEVVLGEIKEIEKHPDANKLQVTKTCIGKNSDGSENIQQIVCGANNIAVGQRIPVATVGSQVINRHDGTTFEIKKAKIRGVESLGMLCSSDELGFSEEESEKIKEAQGDGIYILSEIAKGHDVGADIRKVLGFKKDFVLDVGARSNRGDALSIIGQARELAALMSKEVTYKPIKDLKDLESRLGDAASQIKLVKNSDLKKTVSPNIEDPKDCSVFFTLNVENLKICESPAWLKQRLEAMGTRSINSLVDVSNYVLLELGQPMHFYDRDKLKTDTLDVRRAKQGEKIKTLDDNEYDLSEANLLIADGAKPVCVAGAMGGFDSQITEATTNLVIEAAAFTAASVRRSARAAGIESESKKRFERGVDRTRTQQAILRAVELLAQIAKENAHEPLVIGEIIKAGDDKPEKKTVNLEISQVKRYLGVEIDTKTIIELLKPLEITLVKESKDSLEFDIPTFRQADVYRQEDIIEEIGRLYGFDKIPYLPPSTSVTASHETEKEAKLGKIKEVMIAFGFSQAMLSSLVGDKLTGAEAGEAGQNKFAQIFDFEKEIRMLNPLSREHSTLRQSLIPGLIQAASRNYAYDKSANIKLFELGKSYIKNLKFKGVKDKDNCAQQLTIERDRVSGIMISSDNSWKKAKPEAEDFYKLKAVVENLHPHATYGAIDDSVFANISHPGISATVFEGKKDIGYVAKLHPSLAKEWDLPDNTYIFEVDMPRVKAPSFKQISNNPVVERDITVDLASEISSQQVIDLINKQKLKDLNRIDLLGFYQADANSDSKSLTYRLRWQSQTETLSGDEIDKQVTDIKSALEKDLGASFRA